SIPWHLTRGSRCPPTPPGGSVQLSARGHVAPPGGWTPPPGAATPRLSTASSSPSPSKSPGTSPGTSPSSSPGQGKTPAPLPSSPVGVALPPPGPVPALNNASSSLIGPGNAAGLFPPIGPSATPNPAAGVQAAGSRQNPGAVSSASPVALGAPVLTAQV